MVTVKLTSSIDLRNAEEIAGIAGRYIFAVKGLGIA